MKQPVIIAEIGCNHNGSFENALKMIEIAADFCQVNGVKFQKRSLEEFKDVFEKPHPEPEQSFGNTYREHREFLEFSMEQHAILRDVCRKKNLFYSCSVWDLKSAMEITSLQPDYLKIPSAMNTHFEMLEWICKNYFGEIHLSLGMTRKQEEKEIISLLSSLKRLGDTVLFACTSCYPCSFEDSRILEVQRLREDYTGKVKSIGFSGHHLGIALDISAITLGAEYIERHFTLDRTWKGSDHPASLEPDGLRKLVRDCKAVYSSWNYRGENLLECEIPSYTKMKYQRKIPHAE